MNTAQFTITITLGLEVDLDKEHQPLSEIITTYQERIKEEIAETSIEDTARLLIAVNSIDSIEVKEIK